MPRYTRPAYGYPRAHVGQGPPPATVATVDDVYRQLQNHVMNDPPVDPNATERVTVAWGPLLLAGVAAGAAAAIGAGLVNRFIFGKL